MKRTLLCIIAVFCFLTGIFGSACSKDTVVWLREEPMQQEAGSAMLLSVDFSKKLDDFHIMSDTGGTVSGILLHKIREPLAWLAAAVVFLLLWLLPYGFPRYFGTKNICVFQVITFIHRTDGKKKSCFVCQKENRTGGYQIECWGKIQDIIHR